LVSGLAIRHRPSPVYCRASNRASRLFSVASWRWLRAFAWKASFGKTRPERINPLALSCFDAIHAGLQRQHVLFHGSNAMFKFCIGQPDHGTQFPLGLFYPTHNAGLAVQNVLMAFGDLLDLAPQTLRDHAEIPLGLFEFVIDPGKSLVDPGKLLVDPGKPLVDPGKLLIDPGKSLVDPGKLLVDPGKPLVDPGKLLIDSGKPMINGAEHSLQEFSRLFVHLVPREIVENPQALPNQAFKSAHYGLLVSAGDQGASLASIACGVQRLWRDASVASFVAQWR
jgi:hypothetical protein